MASDVRSRLRRYLSGGSGGSPLTTSQVWRAALMAGVIYGLVSLAIDVVLFDGEQSIVATVAGAIVFTLICGALMIFRRRSQDMSTGP